MLVSVALSVYVIYFNGLLYITSLKSVIFF